MGIAIRIDETIYNAAKKTASAEYRSIPNQIEYWATIGKCALDNPDLPIEFIKDVLIAKNTDRSLAEPFEFEGKSD
ncbi:MAG: ParD-like family protein [Gammaproteobacteria bacterium]|nr:ParD-like family protein [Gammaproteobacteria bacterium]